MGNMRKEISIRHGSRMANRMLQYLYAKELQRNFPEYDVTGYAIPEWDLVGPPPSPGKRRFPKLTIQRFDPKLIHTMIAEGRLDQLMIRSVCGNFAALPDRAFANSLFDASHVQATATTDDDIVIHVRLDDILVPGRHRDYGPLQLGFYQQVVERSGRRPVFIGQLGDDWYSDALRQRFNDATFLEGGSVLHDFETLRRAHHVVLAISTFSWMAAWLSDAKTIHYPLSGLFHPMQVASVDMIPLDDPRYRFYLFPTRKWDATPEQQAELRAPFEATVLSKSDVCDLRDRSFQAWEPEFSEWREAFPREAAAYQSETVTQD